MQTLVNLDNGEALSRAVQSADQNIGAIKWLSSLYEDDYKELKTDQIEGVEKKDLQFWPNNGPWWDGVGIDEKGCIILVEAKGHTRETMTKCSAKSERSIQRIKQSMKEVHDSLVPTHTYNEDVWYRQYYQLGNRLTFLVKLREKGLNVKLVLLNIVDDPTHIKTTEDQWREHYNEVFSNMLGISKAPENVFIVNLRV